MFCTGKWGLMVWTADKQKRRRHALRASGRCVDCGKDAGGKARCRPCKNEELHRQRMRNAKGRITGGQRCPEITTEERERRAHIRQAIAGAKDLRIEGERADVPYEQDVACQIVVAAHPGGMMLEEVAEVMGLTRERVRQIIATVSRRAQMMRGPQVEFSDDRPGLWDEIALLA